jgi:hypothetical protein
MRPGGIWQKVASPILKASETGDAVKLTVTCPTEGCSIAYTTDTGPAARWKLYAGELTLKRTSTIRVKGCRLGYLDSDEVLRQFP